MDQDRFALVEKILKDLENVMSKNAELSSFDIIPVDSNFRNKSPVMHSENSFGLESWCVKHVYMYCYSELMDKCFPKEKRKTAKVSLVNSERLIKLMNITLLLNPELSLFWNKRREMAQRLQLDKILELRFTRLVLSRKSKCNDAFAYRRWILDLIVNDKNLLNSSIDSIADEELTICKLTADRSPNNYHSWNHRMCVISTIKCIKNYDITPLHVREYEFSERWISTHISDYSCFHYRQFCVKNILGNNTDEVWRLIQNVVDVDLHKCFVRQIASFFTTDVSPSPHMSEDQLLKCSDDFLVNLILVDNIKSCNCTVQKDCLKRRLELLFHELTLNNELIKFYKNHETLWYHRRFIIHEILRLMYDYFCLVREKGVLVKVPCSGCQPDVALRQKQAKIVRYDSSNLYSCILFQMLLRHEQSFLEERKLDGDNYADRHDKYLKFVEGVRHV